MGFIIVIIFVMHIAIFRVLFPRYQLFVVQRFCATVQSITHHYKIMINSVNIKKNLFSYNYGDFIVFLLIVNKESI